MRHTARAVLINSQGLCFLAIHNHFIPENIGKWGTVGGIMDLTDTDIESCLARELAEEFAGTPLDAYVVGPKLREIVKGRVTHHFFCVRTDLAELLSSQPEEVLESRFMGLDEVHELQIT